jgi:hypothetical protein
LRERTNEGQTDLETDGSRGGGLRVLSPLAVGEGAVPDPWDAVFVVQGVVRVDSGRDASIGGNGDRGLAPCIVLPVDVEVRCGLQVAVVLRPVYG